MRILIVGAGVVGLTSAYYLNRAGHDVTVVDRHADVARETSFGNGGQLSYSYVAPLAGPGVVSQLPGWLVRRDAPVQWHPRLSLEQWRWCFAFLRACTRARSELTTRELLTLSFLSRKLMHELVASEPDLDFDFTHSGKLVVHRDRRAFTVAQGLVEYQRTLGCEQQVMDARACAEIEPALASVSTQLAGGIFTPGEDTGDCRRFCETLADVLRFWGVRLALGTTIDSLRASANGAVQAVSQGTAWDADQIVMASGASAPHLLSPLGVHAPVYPLKGYSLTYALGDDTDAPRISVTDSARKVVYARLGARMRVAGIADIGVDSIGIDPARIATLQAQVGAMFPGAAQCNVVEQWAGLRPATPRGTPLIGPTRYRNLWLNIGHGALGFTLAAGSAALLAGWIAGSAGDTLHRTFAPHASSR